MNRALVIVDVQNDFCEGGSLPVAGGAAVAAAITEHVRAAGGRYAAVAGTRDWHIDPGAHFSEQPDYLTTWPVHCVAGAFGSQIHPGLDADLVAAWFTKGEHTAAYSGFEGVAEVEGRRVPLVEWLRERRIDAVDVVGIATDYCVRATAFDAVREGFTTRVLLPLTAGVAAASTEAALAELRAAGAELVDDLKNLPG